MSERSSRLNRFTNYINNIMRSENKNIGEGIVVDDYLKKSIKHSNTSCAQIFTDNSVYYAYDNHLGRHDDCELGIINMLEGLQDIYIKSEDGEMVQPSEIPKHIYGENGEVEEITYPYTSAYQYIDQINSAKGMSIASDLGYVVVELSSPYVNQVCDVYYSDDITERQISGLKEIAAMVESFNATLDPKVQCQLIYHNVTTDKTYDTLEAAIYDINKNKGKV